MSLHRRLRALESFRGAGPVDDFSGAALDADIEQLLDEAARREGKTPDAIVAEIAADLEAEGR